MRRHLLWKTHTSPRSPRRSTLCLAPSRQDHQRAVCAHCSARPRQRRARSRGKLLRLQPRPGMTTPSSHRLPRRICAPGAASTRAASRAPRRPRNRASSAYGAPSSRPATPRRHRHRGAQRALRESGATQRSRRPAPTSPQYAPRQLRCSLLRNRPWLTSEPSSKPPRRQPPAATQRSAGKAAAAARRRSAARTATAATRPPSPRRPGPSTRHAPRTSSTTRMPKSRAEVACTRGLRVPQVRALSACGAPFSRQRSLGKFRPEGARAVTHRTESMRAGSQMTIASTSSHFVPRSPRCCLQGHRWGTCGRSCSRPRERRRAAPGRTSPRVPLWIAASAAAAPGRRGSRSSWRRRARRPPTRPRGHASSWGVPEPSLKAAPTDSCRASHRPTPVCALRPAAALRAADSGRRGELPRGHVGADGRDALAVGRRAPLLEGWRRWRSVGPPGPWQSRVDLRRGSGLAEIVTASGHGIAWAALDRAATAPPPQPPTVMLPHAQAMSRKSGASKERNRRPS
mmetsp:Transcript_9352/g.26923  ORF Transcript_9352/g.26923 Transcript_9352/m.26923 type:complete len:514 (+) Transcript_9352:202-1743(+)